VCCVVYVWGKTLLAVSYPEIESILRHHFFSQYRCLQTNCRNTEISMIVIGKRSVATALLLLSVASSVNGFIPVSLQGRTTAPLSKRSLLDKPECESCSSGIITRGDTLKQSASTHEATELLLGDRHHHHEDDDDPFSVAFRQQYTQWSKKYYLTMAAVQSGTIAFGADVMTQKMEGVNHIDFSHVFAIMVVAATASGSFNAFWLRKIEHAFPGRAPRDVFIKAMISTLLLGAAINVGYIVGIPLLSSTIFAPNGLAHLPPLDPKVLLTGWTTEEFITLTKVECTMFLPYHLLAFNLVPPQIRPLTQAAMAGSFNVVVSAVTLGIFDIWVGEAIQAVGLS